MANVKDIKRNMNQVQLPDQADDWMKIWSRLGFAARGLLYGLIAWLAIQLVITGRGQITDQTGALASLASQPFGKILLILVTIGLTGYAMYCFIRAIFDPFKKGTGAEGIISRLAYFITGIVYSSLVFPAYQMIQGAGRSQSGTQKMQAFAADVMSKPYGRYAVMAVGVIIIGVGLYEIYFGWKKKFTKNFDSYRMEQHQREIATRMGTFGYIALGTVLAIVGFLAFSAGLNYSPQQVGGIDASLAWLLHQAYGPVLLIIVALGLLAYAVYSIMGALWFRVKVK